MFKQILKIVLKYKLIAVIIGILVISSSSYFGYRAFKNKSAETRYVLVAVEKGVITSSVSGSGQVSASNQVDVKAKTSGDIVYVGVKKGQEVKAGALLSQIDTSDAKKSVRDAEVNLETAKLSLEKLENSTQSGDDQLKKTYDDGLNEAAETFTDLSSVLDSLNGILFGTAITDNLGATNKTNNIEYYADVVDSYDSSFSAVPSHLKTSYADAKIFYNQAFNEYKTVNRNSASDSIETAIKDTYTLTKKVSDIIKTAADVIQFFKDKSIQENWSFNEMDTVNEHLSDLSEDSATVNSHFSNLFSAVQSFTTDQINLKSQKLTVEQKENALLDAQEELADCFIRAPFDGIIAEIDVDNGDTISTSAVIATLITKQRIAELSFNEVDVAKIKTGQKAILTFDAVSDLSISGEVTEVDIIGTVTQGVVTYRVKIGFDTQDERVKPGMSVSAEIITEAKQDVLLISNSAIKSSVNGDYVEILSGISSSTQALNSSGITSKTSPTQQAVEVGLSNDMMTEITSGLEEGDMVIIKTITSLASQTNQSQSSNGSSGAKRNNTMMMFR